MENIQGQITQVQQVPIEQGQTEQKVVNNGSNKTLITIIILLVILLVLILGGVLVGGYFLWQKDGSNKKAEKANNSVSETPTFPPTVILTPTLIKENNSDWKKFLSEKIGFKISYPAEVTLKEVEDGSVNLSVWGPTQREQTEFYDGININIRSGQLNGRTLMQIADSEVENAKDYGEVLIYPKAITINGREGVTLKTRGLGEFTYIYLPSSNNKYIVITDGTNDPTNKGYAEMVGKILGSLEVIE